MQHQSWKFLILVRREFDEAWKVLEIFPNPFSDVISFLLLLFWRRGGMLNHSVRVNYFHYRQFRCENQIGEKMKRATLFWVKSQYTPYGEGEGDWNLIEKFKFVKQSTLIFFPNSMFICCAHFCCKFRVNSYVPVPADIRALYVG